MMFGLHLNPFGLDLKNKSREMPWTKAIKVPNYGNVKTCIPFLWSPIHSIAFVYIVIITIQNKIFQDIHFL